MTLDNNIGGEVEETKIVQFQPALQKEIPEVIGELEIISKVGEGGMASVYKARHRTLGIDRAIKVLSPKYSKNEEFVRKFNREAQIAARLQHPNIVTIHNTGSRGDIHYIEMEYIDGVTLNKIKPPGGKIPLPIALLIIQEICKALDHAHKREFTYHNEQHHSIVHRDIKPSNIMITNDGNVKLTDFGIARAVEITEETMTGTLVGTIPYMSKEQIDGQQIDHRTDIYSLGVVLYELLTNEKPFGDTPITKVVKRISTGKYRPVRELNPQVPKKVELIIEKAMALYPKDRYQDVMDMYKDIQTCLMGYRFNSPQEEIKRYLKEKETYKPDEIIKLTRKRNIIWINMGIIVILVATLFVGYFLLFQKFGKSKLWVISDLPGIKVYLNGELVAQTNEQFVLIEGISRGKYSIDVYLTSIDKKLTREIVVDDIQKLEEFNFLKELGEEIKVERNG